MHLKEKNMIFFVIIIFIIIFLYVYFYSKGSFDEKLPNMVKHKTLSKEVKKIKENINLIDNIKINKNMENYTKTESGLEYKVIRMGDGEKPKATDTVEVHYEGKLEDGTVFDSSYARGEKISFGLNQVISGWTEGLQLMPIGSEFEFKIPADLAYGDRALPGIPAGSTLIFKVELFDIK